MISKEDIETTQEVLNSMAEQLVADYNYKMNRHLEENPFKAEPFEVYHLNNAAKTFKNVAEYIEEYWVKNRK